MLKRFKTVVLGLIATLALLCQSAFAAMSAADETAIKAGLTSSDTIFYSIGGAILIVLAGIWGFKKVQALMGGK